VFSSNVVAGTVAGAATVVADGGTDGGLCVQPTSAHMLVAKTTTARLRRRAAPKRSLFTVFASVD
jgi:hypothetical protein